MLPDKLFERYTEPHRVYPEDTVITTAQKEELDNLAKCLKSTSVCIIDMDKYKKQQAEIEKLKEMCRNASLC